MPFWAPYVPVAQRRANALREMEKLRKKGKNIQPICIEGRTVARSFWGKAWCDHLESFSDFKNRLPRGRTYVRNGSVCHLDIQPGRIEAIVSGSHLYNVSIEIKKLKPDTWMSVKERCAGKIGTMLELLQGKLSGHVMGVVTDRTDGLFPQPREIELCCNCPDWATMCKHVAAVLYGVGSRLDDRPELLFLLRNVDAQELISSELAMPTIADGQDVLDASQLGDVFGIELENTDTTLPVTPTKRRQSNRKPRPIVRVVPQQESGVGSAGHAGRGNGQAAKKVMSRTVVRKTLDEVSTSVPPSRTSRAAAARFKPTGSSIARLRKRLGLSVAEFSRRLKVSPGSVHRWEATKGRLKLHARPLAALDKLRQEIGLR